MKLIFELFVILQPLFYTIYKYIFRKVYLSNIHFFDNDVTVFIESVTNGNYNFFSCFLF